MKLIVLATLLLTATTLAIAATPEASAGCAVNENDVVGSVEWCAQNDVQTVECLALGC
jgi:Spy/CpxP family protein refolding chaperone